MSDPQYKNPDKFKQTNMLIGAIVFKFLNF